MHKKNGNTDRSKTVILNGTPSSPGIAYGPVFLYDKSEPVISTSVIASKDIREEQAKIQSAIRVVDLELRKVEQFTREDPDEETSAETSEILAFQREILKDPDLLSSINQNIRQDLVTADRAIFSAFRLYLDRLKNSPSSFFKDRIPDLKEIRDRLIQAVQQKKMLQKIPEQSVVVCRELSPGDIILFARKKVKALVSERGGLTSHASIIAKSMGIPFVFGVNKLMSTVSEGDTIIVDGSSGTITVHPDDELLEIARLSISAFEILEQQRQSVSNEPCQTKCGRKITVQANVELETELDRVKLYNAEGIGLLRTEAFFLYGQNENEQTADDPNREQRSFLEKAARTIGEQNITVRLFDVGGDKLPGYAKEEANPFLGWRGIRILLSKPALLYGQLELILKTLSKHPCKTSIMVPMITGLEEVIQVRTMFDRAVKKLEIEPLSVKLGIMIEVPSAALTAGYLAPYVDFFSIGTNDLTQYTLAADRTNRMVHQLYNSMHPAVWQLIKKTVDAGNEHNIPVSVCGEMASSPVAASLLVGLGITRLSMNAASIPDVKQYMRGYKYDYLKTLAEEIVKAGSVKEVDEICKRMNEQ